MRKIEMLNAPHALDILYRFMRGRTGRSYRGFKRTDPFKALIGTMLSLRARGVTVERVEEALFHRASTAQEILDMPLEELTGLIRPLGHSNRRAQFIHATCQQLVSQYGGKVPEDMDKLLELPGVGRKTANLTLDAGFGHTTVTVDTHVHRIMNIWNYVQTKNANETEEILRQKLPKKYWKWFNPLLVDFGNLVCLPASPRCNSCPLDVVCPKRGLSASQKSRGERSALAQGLKPRRTAA